MHERASVSAVKHATDEDYAISSVVGSLYMHGVSVDSQGHRILSEPFWLRSSLPSVFAVVHVVTGNVALLAERLVLAGYGVEC